MYSSEIFQRGEKVWAKFGSDWYEAEFCNMSAMGNYVCYSREKSSVSGVKLGMFYASRVSRYDPRPALGPDVPTLRDIGLTVDKTGLIVSNSIAIPDITSWRAALDAGVTFVQRFELSRIGCAILDEYEAQIGA